METTYESNISISIIRSESRKFIYSKMPKNAGTSIYRGILEKEVKDAELLHPKELIPSIGYFAFTVVRNPYDRIVSLWNYFKGIEKRKRIPQCTFKEFLQKDYFNYNGSMKLHANPQYHRIYYDGYIARFENLEHDWKYIANKIGVKNSLPMSNKRNHEVYTKYYDDWCIDKVSELYQKDLEVLDYKFGD